jgi:outer membrane protein, adhesin transport system
MNIYRFNASLNSSFILLCLFYTTPNQAETIQSAVQKAINTHPTVMAAQASYATSKEAVVESESALSPSVLLRLTKGIEDSENETTRNRVKATGAGNNLKLSRQEGSLTISQLLFDGFASSNRVSASKERQNGSHSALIDTSQIIGLRAVEAYLEIIRQQIRVAYAKKNVKQHQQILDKTKFKANAGGGTSADVQQVQSRLEVAKSTLVEFKGLIKNSEARYIEVFGALPKLKLKTPRSAKKALPANISMAIQRGIKNSPSYQASAKELSASRYDVKATRGAYYPSFSAEISRTENKNLGGLQATGYSTMGQLVMNYTFYDGDNRGAVKRQAYTRMYESLYRLEEAKRLLQQDIRINYNTYLTSGIKLPVLESNVDTSKKVLKSYQSQFEIGKKTLINLLDAQNEVFQSNVTYTDGKFSYLFSQYQLLASTGELLKYLGVIVNDSIQFNYNNFESLGSISNNSHITKSKYAKPSPSALDYVQGETIEDNLDDNLKYLRISSFNNFQSANKLKQNLQSKGVKNLHIIVESINNQTNYQVEVGPVQSQQTHASSNQQLNAAGIKTVNIIKR